MTGFDELDVRAGLRDVADAGEVEPVDLPRLLTHVHRYRSTRRRRSAVLACGTTLAVLVAAVGVGAGTGIRHRAAPISRPSPDASTTMFSCSALFPGRMSRSPGVPIPTLNPSQKASASAAQALQQRINDLSVIVMPLDPELKSQFPNSYATAFVNAEGTGFILYRVPDPALDAAFRQRIGSYPVEFRVAVQPFQRQLALLNRIDFTDADFWKSRGLVLRTALRPDGRIDVEASDPKAAQPLLDARYGEGLTIAKILTTRPACAA